MSTKQARNARITVRISSEALTLVRRAGEIQGRSVGDFIVADAQEAARQTIEETPIARLSPEDQRLINRSH